MYVDIPNLFRDFNADENDPASFEIEKKTFVFLTTEEIKIPK